MACLMFSWNLSERVEKNIIFLCQDKQESQPSFWVFISSKHDCYVWLYRVYCVSFFIFFFLHPWKYSSSALLPYLSPDCSPNLTFCVSALLLMLSGGHGNPPGTPKHARLSLPFTSSARCNLSTLGSLLWETYCQWVLRHTSMYLKQTSCFVTTPINKDSADRYHRSHVPATLIFTPGWVRASLFCVHPHYGTGS